MFALESAYFPELFGTRVRYSGASFGFQLSELRALLATVTFAEGPTRAGWGLQQNAW